MGDIRYESDRIILRRTPREADVAYMAGLHGWQKGLTIADDPAAGELYQVLRATNKGSTISYIEDAVSRNCYAVVASRREQETAALARLLTEELNAWERPQLLLSVDESADALDRARAVVRLGLGAPRKFDEDFFTRIRAACTDENEWIREAAVWATSYSPWSQHRPLLEATAEKDSVGKIREKARLILKGFDRAGVDSGPRSRQEPRLDHTDGT